MRTGSQAGARIRWRAAAALILVLPSLCPAAQLGEYRIKAAFLYNFAKFVHWPGETGSGRPLTYVVFGKDPFGDELDKVLAGRTIRGRPVAVRRVNRVEDLEPCDLVFIPRSESKRLGEVFRRLEGQAVLRVGETPDFLREGGMINFVLQDNRVRFEISAATARHAGIEISSQLLSLATLVVE